MFDWNSPLLAADVALLSTRHGYNGHEHLDELGLIHMNGRLYDPLLGRFVSADPNVQSPRNSQSLNRYSYVLNNLLSLSDPSGYFWKSLGNFFKDNWRSIAAIGLTFTGMNPLITEFVSGFEPPQ